MFVYKSNSLVLYFLLACVLKLRSDRDLIGCSNGFNFQGRISCFLSSIACILERWWWRTYCFFSLPWGIKMERRHKHHHHHPLLNSSQHISSDPSPHFHTTLSASPPPFSWPQSPYPSPRSTQSLAPSSPPSTSHSHTH